MQYRNRLYLQRCELLQDVEEIQRIRAQEN
jgi:hypothetical protein